MAKSVATSDPASPLASASTAAPPNFYEAAAKMQGGAGAGGQGQPGQGQSPSSPSPSPKDPDREFLESIPKLFSIFDKMKAMRPGGKDISKYMDAMAQTLKDCSKEVFGGAGGEKDGMSKGTAGDSTGDGGDTSGAGGAGAGGTGSGSGTSPNLMAGMTGATGGA